MPLHSDPLVRPLRGVELGLEVGSRSNNDSPRETPFTRVGGVSLIRNEPSPSQKPSELSGSFFPFVGLNKACRLEATTLRPNEVLELRGRVRDVGKERAKAAARRVTSKRENGRRIESRAATASARGSDTAEGGIT